MHNVYITSLLHPQTYPGTVKKVGKHSGWAGDNTANFEMKGASHSRFGSMSMASIKHVHQGYANSELAVRVQ